MKSHESDLLELAACVYKDAAAKCTAVQPDVRDLKTLRSRVEHEGLSFLTITLPTFGSDFERSLAAGRIEPTLFRSFKKSGRAPSFLKGFLAQVFDVTGTGGILDEPSPTAVEGIRQIAYTFKKLQVACTPKRVKQAFKAFAECEHEFESDLAPADIEHFVQVSAALWASLLHRRNYGEISTLVPKHGPGATADRTLGNRKYVFRKWYDRLEPYFPMLHNAFSSESAYGSKEFGQCSVISEDCEEPVRVIAVPKTLKKPRIIAIEPVCMQYVQQAISERLVTVLEESRIAGGHVNFTDQTVNRDLALSSSLSKSYATLDLSAASDRVPLTLALSMFRSNQDLLGAIAACRSRTAQVPEVGLIPLKKFASMGSALCFPIEAMYFYTICVGALLVKHKLPVTPLNAYKVSRDVYVYGDDILVPTDDAVFVADHLQKYYCKVNMSKSFWSGNFRESCGMDAFLGEEVTPTYVKRMLPSNKRSVNEFLSTVETSNLFYERGYWQTASFLVERCERLFGTLPIVRQTSAGVGLRSFQPVVSSGRWNRLLQRFEVKCWKAVPVYRRDPLGGYSALLKCLLEAERRPSGVEQQHVNTLKVTARYGAVALQRRWVQAY